MKYNLFLLSLISLMFIGCNQSQHADILIEGVHIVDVQNTQLIENQSIAIRDGKIIDVFDVKTKEISYDSLIDGTDKYAMPGLWDMHVHFRGGEELISDNEAFLSQFIKYGITSVRDAGGDLTNSILEWNNQIKKRDLDGPTIYTSGPKLDGNRARWEGSLPVTTAAEVTAALDSLQRLGADFVKIYDSTLDLDIYMEIVKQTEERGMNVTGHMPLSIYLKDAVDAGLDGIEHMYYVIKACSSKEDEITAAVKNGEYGFWSGIAVALESYDPNKAMEVFSMLAENEVYVTPTLFIGETLANVADVDHSNDEYLELLSAPFISTYEGRVRSARNSSPEAKQFRKDLLDKFEEMIPIMYEAGVNILAGSDAGAYNSFVYPGPSLHGELMKLVDSGIPTEEVLKIVTQNGPAFLEDSASFGSIETDKTADLIILEKNPFEDIRNLTTIQAVIKNGYAVQ